ncbi:MAG: hypothetical protein ABL908_12290 [Hyphomicrobium sp.]
MNLPASVEIADSDLMGKCKRYIALRENFTVSILRSNKHFGRYLRTIDAYLRNGVPDQSWKSIVDSWFVSNFVAVWWLAVRENNYTAHVDQNGDGILIHFSLPKK